MNLIITGTGFGFPNGTGATARVMAFAKGLIFSGNSVHIFCLKPSENNYDNISEFPVDGVYDGIHFKYSCGQRFIAKTRFGALILYLKGLLNAYLSIKSIHRKESVDAILLWYAENPINVFVFKLLAWSIGAVLIAEECEQPFVYYQNLFALKIRVWFNDHVTYKLLDGAIVISTYLHDYFATRISKSAKILRIPILVDTSAFLPVDDMVSENHKIVYCGNLEHDGEVADLLYAFSQVALDFPQWVVEVIGPLPNDSIHNSLLIMVDKIGLSGRVNFVGAVPRSEIPDRLADGSIMALPRASGKFSAAGFPTKLGEYLATGKPVIVTNTGDISRYLKNGVNAYVVPADDTLEFAQAMRYVMSHPQEAQDVGRRGRDVAISQFDMMKNCNHIIKFIQALKMTTVV